MLRMITKLAVVATFILGVTPGRALAQSGDVGNADVAAKIDVGGEAGADGGAQRWRSGDRAGALSFWTSRLEGGSDLSTAERSRLAYNLGIAEYERGEPLRAVAWFEAALRAVPRDEGARVNLGIARAEAGLEPRGSDGFTATLGSIAASVTRPESEWLALGAALLLALAGLGEALRGGALWRRAALLALLAQPVLFAPLVRHVVLADTQPYMVIDPDGARTRSAPSADAERLGSLPPGAIVEYVDELPGWTKVKGDGEERWVEASKLFDLQL